MLRRTRRPSTEASVHGNMTWRTSDFISRSGKDPDWSRCTSFYAWNGVAGAAGVCPKAVSGS